MVGKTVTSTTLEGLYQATEYTLDVRSVSGLDDLAEESEPVSQTTLTIPRQPSSFVDTLVTADEISLSWLRPPSGNFDSYELSYTPENGAKVTLPDLAADENSLVLENLGTATEYIILLRTRAGLNTFSEPLELTVTTRSALLALQPIPDPTSDVSLDWDQEAGSIQRYILTYDPNNGDPISPIRTGIPGPVSISGLMPGSQYTFRLFSVLTTNVQFLSSSVSHVTIADTTIPMASNFAVTNTRAADHVIILEWDVPERASYDYFEVSYTPDVGYPSSPVRLPKAATSLSIMNALADKVYQFSLVSIRGDERTDPPLTTTGQIAVNNLIVVIGERTTTSLEILWGASASGSVDEYQVSYVGSTPIVVDGSSDRRVVIPGLSPGTEYTVTVQAINAGAAVGDSMETASTLHEMNGLSAMVTDQASSMIHLTITPPLEMMI
eukprot:XP_011675852.1 PREDICTED: fibronectin-like [Strongylocentrotus purpuratus]